MRSNSNAQIATWCEGTAKTTRRMQGSGKIEEVPRVGPLAVSARKRGREAFVPSQATADPRPGVPFKTRPAVPTKTRASAPLLLFANSPSGQQPTKRPRIATTDTCPRAMASHAAPRTVGALGWGASPCELNAFCCSLVLWQQLAQRTSLAGSIHHIEKFKFKLNTFLLQLYLPATVGMVGALGWVAWAVDKLYLMHVTD